MLADGTSAIYGSDAVAGVVNVVPRLRFAGAESSFRVGTADGDSEDVLASQILGAARAASLLLVKQRSRGAGAL